jgi:heptosyltransferase-2
VQCKTMPPCQPCHRPVCSMNEHRCMRDIAASDVAGIAERVLAAAGAGMAP